MRGIARPVKPHRVVDILEVNTRFEAARRHGFTAFTGRHEELARLHACLEKTVAGKGQFVTVTGEAGAGKSRLAYEFRHRLDRKSITVLQGRCQSYGSNIPYFPFLNALKRGLLLKEEDSTAELEKKSARMSWRSTPPSRATCPCICTCFPFQSSDIRCPEACAANTLKIRSDRPWLKSTC